MAGLGEGEFDPELREARQRLESLRSGVPSRTTDGRNTGGERDASVRGVGTAAQERVQAVAARGRLERLDLDPRAMRASAQELGEQIAEAVNAALTDLRAQASAAGTGDSEPVADPAVLAESLRQVQEEGLRQMTMITRSISDVTARIQSRTR